MKTKPDIHIRVKGNIKIHQMRKLIAFTGNTVDIKAWLNLGGRKQENIEVCLHQISYVIEGSLVGWKGSTIHEKYNTEHSLLNGKRCQYTTTVYAQMVLNAYKYKTWHLKL